MSNDSGTSEDKLSSEEDEDREEIQSRDAIDASKNDVPKWNNAEVDKDDPIVEQDGTDDNGDRETEGGGANSGEIFVEDGTNNANANEKSKVQGHTSNSSSNSEA